MKKLMIALALVGISFTSAEAQTKGSVTKETCKCASTAKTAKANKVAHGHMHHSSTSGDVYQVCVEKNGHYDCCMHHKKVTSVATK